MKQGRLKACDPTPVSAASFLARRLAEQTGLMMGSPATVISYQGELTPFRHRSQRIPISKWRVFSKSGIRSSIPHGRLCRLPAAQRVLDLNDVVNTIELRLDDIFKAPQVADSSGQNHRAETDGLHLDGTKPFAY